MFRPWFVAALVCLFVSVPSGPASAREAGKKPVAASKRKKNSAPVPAPVVVPAVAPPVVEDPGTGGAGRDAPVTAEWVTPRPERTSTRPPIYLEARALVGVPDLGGVSVTVLPWKWVLAEAGGAPATKTFYLRGGAFYTLLDETGALPNGEAWVVRTGAQVGFRHFGDFGLGLNAVAELAGTYWLPRGFGINFQVTAGTMYVGPNWQWADFPEVASPWFPDVRASGGVTLKL